MLEKKSGGKEGKSKWKLSEKWSKRWFVLAPERDSMLRYYKTEGDALSGKEALGDVECRGATVFLKEVKKGGIYRFTVRSNERSLKLRAPNQQVFNSWVEALKPFARGIEDEDDEMNSTRMRGETMADGDDDDSD
jgi:hypothetical protein